MRLRFSSVLLPGLLPALLPGCAADDKADGIAFCDGPYEMYYDPDPAGKLTAFPDDHWTEADPSAATGLRVAMRTAETPGLDEYPDNFVGIFDDLSTLDGFGLTAGIWMHAWQVLPEIPAEDFHVYADGARWPVSIRMTDDGSTVLAVPLRPLPEAAEVTAILRTDPASPECVAPSPRLRRLLDPALDGAPDPAPLHADQWRRALAATKIPAEEVAGMVVFTTQSATALSDAVAADIAGRSYAIAPDPACADTGAGFSQCDALLDVQDYRGDDRTVPVDSRGEPQGSYALPVRVWLPATGAAPWPVVLCGHGLGGGRDQCRTLAEYGAPYGMAVVAVDAVEHGDHPGRTEAPMDLIADFMIFAIGIDPPGLSALRLRDNFRQSAWDKLQVVQAILQGVDLTGDGQPDLDPARISYAGVSLGAIMGPQLMAHTGAIRGGALAVGGGRLSSIIQESESFSLLVEVMRPPEVTDGDVDRFFPLLQTAIDSADPAVYAARMAEAPPEGAAPHLLLMLAHGDAIIPNSSSEALDRALSLPLVGTEVWAFDGMTATPAPTWENLPSGATGGMVQYAVTQPWEGAPWEPADHSTLHESVQGRAQLLEFLEPLSRGDIPVISEPQRP